MPYRSMDETFRFEINKTMFVQPKNSIVSINDNHESLRSKIKQSSHKTLFCREIKKYFTDVH